MTPQIEYEHIQSLMDEHIASKVKGLEKYAERPSAKQDYIDREWKIINMHKELKKATLAYIAAMNRELTLARVNTAMQARVISELNIELGKHIEQDILLDGETNG